YALDAEAALLREGCDVGFGRVGDAFAVVALLELRDELLALYLAHYAVGQIAFEVAAHLRVILAVVNGDYQQQPALLGRTDSPAAHDRQRIIEDVLAAGRFDGDDAHLHVGLLVLAQILEDVIQSLLGRGVNHVRVVNDRRGRARLLNRRLHFLRAQSRAAREQADEEKERETCASVVMVSQ